MTLQPNKLAIKWKYHRTCRETRMNVVTQIGNRIHARSNDLSVARYSGSWKSTYIIILIIQSLIINTGWKEEHNLVIEWIMNYQHKLSAIIGGLGNVRITSAKSGREVHTSFTTFRHRQNYEIRMKEAKEYLPTLKHVEMTATKRGTVIGDRTRRAELSGNNHDFP